ncbi:hypothetical protein NPIL_337301 [Nephila pilipes]|uniref:Uncharacterized protein n=1 Tax=Nephila pilipes TaxID=299642 RepID=A0A8X6PVQ7_NEPPI|nr:hypothetical protein NPIL_337301 [Nephila pilipes]
MPSSHAPACLTTHLNGNFDLLSKSVLSNTMRPLASKNVVIGPASGVKRCHNSITSTNADLREIWHIIIRIISLLTEKKQILRRLEMKQIPKQTYQLKGQILMLLQFMDQKKMS